MSIDWNQKRKVFRDTETNEFYVQVGKGSKPDYDQFMLDYDYVEGGRTELRLQIGTLEEVGTFTNAQIDGREYDV